MTPPSFQCLWPNRARDGEREDGVPAAVCRAYSAVGGGEVLRSHAAGRSLPGVFDFALILFFFFS